MGLCVLGAWTRRGGLQAWKGPSALAEWCRPPCSRCSPCDPREAGKATLDTLKQAHMAARRTAAPHL